MIRQPKPMQSKWPSFEGSQIQQGLPSFGVLEPENLKHRVLGPFGKDGILGDGMWGEWTHRTVVLVFCGFILKTLFNQPPVTGCTSFVLKGLRGAYKREVRASTALCLDAVFLLVAFFQTAKVLAEGLGCHLDCRAAVCACANRKW